MGVELFPIGSAATVAQLLDALRGAPGIETDDRQLAAVARESQVQSRRRTELGEDT